MSETEIKIRPAGVADAAGLVRYVEALYSERLKTMFLHATAPTVEEEIRFIDGFDAENALLTVACAGDNVIGMLGFSGHTRPQLRHSGVIGFGVSRPYRRHGIGRRMFEKLIDWAESDPRLSRIECDLFSTNHAALSLLGEFGFEREGTMRRAVEVEGELIDNHLMARLW